MDYYSVSGPVGSKAELAQLADPLRTADPHSVNLRSDIGQRNCAGQKTDVLTTEQCQPIHGCK